MVISKGHTIAHGRRRHRWLLAVLTVVTSSVLSACGEGRTTGVPEAPPPSALSSVQPLNPPVLVDAEYRRDVEAHVAAGLHVPPAIIRSRLRDTPGSTLMNLAKPLGMSEDVVGRIVLAGFDSAADDVAHTARWTAESVRREERYWDAQDVPSLISEVSYWFVYD